MLLKDGLFTGCDHCEFMHIVEGLGSEAIMNLPVLHLASCLKPSYTAEWTMLGAFIIIQEEEKLIIIIDPV